MGVRPLIQRVSSSREGESLRPTSARQRLYFGKLKPMRSSSVAVVQCRGAASRRGSSLSFSAANTCTTPDAREMEPFPLPGRSLSAAGRRLLPFAALLIAGCSELPFGTGPTLGPASGATAGSPQVRMYANPLVGYRFYVDPSSHAARQVDAWRATRPADAAQIAKIASHPQAIWWVGDPAHPYELARVTTARIIVAGAVPVYVLYNIPHRDCGSHSRGGASSGDAYRAWVGEIAAGIGGQPAVVILEPDALPGMDCLPANLQVERLELIRDAVAILKQAKRVAVYIDAGNPGWRDTQTMASRLTRAGIDRADGFALNVANFFSNERSTVFGAELSALVGGKHFVIDSSRNGAGPHPTQEWCNPPGRALGAPATVNTGHPLVDAFLWVNSPGQSDGPCNGGPPPGTWWPDYALDLAARTTG